MLFLAFDGSARYKKYMHAMSNITNYYNGSNAYHAVIPNSRSNHGYELAP